MIVAAGGYAGVEREAPVALLARRHRGRLRLTANPFIARALGSAPIDGPARGHERSSRDDGGGGGWRPWSGASDGGAPLYPLRKERASRDPGDPRRAASSSFLAAGSAWQRRLRLRGHAALPGASPNRARAVLCLHARAPCPNVLVPRRATELQWL